MHRDEQLSTFLDGELSESESRFLIRQLAADKEGREQFDRYNLAGDVMRGATPSTIDLGFADRVMAEIAAEPAAMITNEEDVFVAKVAAGMAGGGVAAVAEAKHVTWARPVISLAMAASVAFVAIILWPNSASNIQDSSDQIAAATVSESTPLQTIAYQAAEEPTAVLAATAEREPEATWELADPEVQRRLSEYVAGYSQYSSAPAGQYSVPFVQTVGLQGRGIQNSD
jgi:negative regulator of sigma E activity